MSASQTLTKTKTIQSRKVTLTTHKQTKETDVAIENNKEPCAIKSISSNDTVGEKYDGLSQVEKRSFNASNANDVKRNYTDRTDEAVWIKTKHLGGNFINKSALNVIQANLRNRTDLTLWAPEEPILIKLEPISSNDTVGGKYEDLFQVAELFRESDRDEIKEPSQINYGNNSTINIIKAKFEHFSQIRESLSALDTDETKEASRNHGKVSIIDIDYEQYDVLYQLARSLSASDSDEMKDHIEEKYVNMFESDIVPDVIFQLTEEYNMYNIGKDDAIKEKDHDYLIAEIALEVATSICMNNPEIAHKIKLMAKNHVNTKNAEASLKRIHDDVLIMVKQFKLLDKIYCMYKKLLKKHLQNKIVNNMTNEKKDNIRRQRSSGTTGFAKHTFALMLSRQKQEHRNTKLRSNSSPRFVIADNPITEGTQTILKQCVVKHIVLQVVISATHLRDSLHNIKSPFYIWPSGHHRLPSKLRRLEEMACIDNIVYNPFLRRLLTFIDKSNVEHTAWPERQIVRPGPLASAGFSYDGHKEEVVCKSCGFKSDVSEWSDDDEDYALSVHMRSNNICDFLNSFGFQLSNRHINDDSRGVN